MKRTRKKTVTVAEMLEELEEMEQRDEAVPALLQNGDNQPNLPTGLSMAEQAAGLLRAFLDSNGLSSWTCFFDQEFSLQGIDGYIKQLDGDDSKVIPFGSLTHGGHQPAAYRESHSEANPKLHPAGIRWFRRYKVIIFCWFELPSLGWKIHDLFAAASVEDFERFCQGIEKLRRRKGRRLWNVWSDCPSNDTPVPRTSRIAWDDLVLDPSVRQRLQTEVIDFFSDHAAAL